LCVLLSDEAINYKIAPDFEYFYNNHSLFFSGSVSQNGSDTDQSAEVDQRPLVVGDGTWHFDALRLPVGDAQPSGPDVSFLRRLASAPSGHVPGCGGHLPGAKRAVSTQDW